MKWYQAHPKCHPSSNGQAQRFVQTFKRAMQAGEKDGLSLNHRLSEFLFTYRTAPHATTDASPSELFLQRQVRTQFDLLKPDHKGLIASRQDTQKKQRNRHAKLRSLAVGSLVMVRDFRHNSKWVPGTIVMKLGPVTYHVDLGGGNIVKRHIDQLTQRLESLPVTLNETTENPTIKDNFQYPETVEQPRQEPVVEAQRDRYPQRVRRPPDRLIPI